MPRIDPDKVLPELPVTTAAQRAIDCLAFLTAHGLVDDQAKQKALDQIRQWVKRGEEKT